MALKTQVLENASTEKASTKHSVGRVEGSSLAKIQLDSFSRFDRTLTLVTDRRTQAHALE